LRFSGEPPRSVFPAFFPDLNRSSGQVSCFFCGVQRLSLRKNQSSTAGTIATAAPDVSSKAPHVLIADTNARTLAARAEQLLAAGLKVSRARTSFEAIVKASCHVPDFILLDGLLGELDVADTLRLLGTCPVTAHIPIFRLSPGRRVPRRVLAAALAQP
jgi:CheY-like chemotaxis protein